MNTKINSIAEFTETIKGTYNGMPNRSTCLTKSFIVQFITEWFGGKMDSVHVENGILFSANCSIIKQLTSDDLKNMFGSDDIYLEFMESLGDRYGVSSKRMIQMVEQVNPDKQLLNEIVCVLFQLFVLDAGGYLKTKVIPYTNSVSIISVPFGELN